MSLGMLLCIQALIAIVAAYYILIRKPEQPARKMEQRETMRKAA